MLYPFKNLIIDAKYISKFLLQVPECQIMCLKHQKDMYWYAQVSKKSINLYLCFCLHTRLPHSRVNRRKLLFRHFVPHFPPNFRDIAWEVGQLNATLVLVTRAKKWNGMECIPPKMKRSHNRRVFAAAPRQPQFNDFIISNENVI